MVFVGAALCVYHIVLCNLLLPACCQRKMGVVKCNYMCFAFIRVLCIVLTGMSLSKSHSAAAERSTTVDASAQLGASNLLRLQLSTVLLGNALQTATTVRFHLWSVSSYPSIQARDMWSHKEE